MLRGSLSTNMTRTTSSCFHLLIYIQTKRIANPLLKVRFKFYQDYSSSHYFPTNKSAVICINNTRTQIQLQNFIYIFIQIFRFQFGTHQKYHRYLTCSFDIHLDTDNCRIWKTVLSHAGF
jgi:hypothetical protein